QSEYAMLGQKFTPSYPKMAQLSARIASLHADLAADRERAVTALAAQFEADKSTEEELSRQLDIEKSKTFELSRHEVQYNIMKREYDSLKQIHQTVLEQLKQAQMNLESTATNVTLVDQAAFPVKPSSPDIFLIMLFALVAGPAAGFGAALLV